MAQCGYTRKVPAGNSHRRHRALVLAAIATAAVLAWLCLDVRFNYGGNWTALFCTGSVQRVPAELAAGTYRFAHPYGYDGQFYRYVAHDPLFRKGFASYIDDARLRSRRILVPALAWLLAAGRPGWIDLAFVAVLLGSIFAGVFWSCRYAAARGAREEWGLLFLALPATLTSMDRMLVDATLAALFAGFLVAAEERRWRALYLLCLAACLTRETGFLMVAACVLYRLTERRIGDAVRFATAGIPALAWYGFVAAHTGPSYASGIVTYPLWGQLRRLFTVRVIHDPVVGEVVKVMDALAVCGLLACFTLAAMWALKRRPGPVEIGVLLFLCLGMVLGSPGHMLEAFGYGRPVSPLLLYVMLEAAARGAWAALAAPLPLTMSVGMFFVSPLYRILQGVVR